MNYIAHLDLTENHSLRGERWRALSVESGPPLRDYHGPPGIHGIIDFIRAASGLVLPYENFLHTPELAEAINECVSGGRPLLVTVDPHSREYVNPF